MAEWRNWSGSIRRPVNEVYRPSSLVDLQAKVRAVGGSEGALHAQGSAWAFSAPAHCADVVIDTRDLRRVPTAQADDISALQRSIIPPLDRTTGRLLVAVEAGIRIHDFYRAFAFDDVDRGPDAEGQPLTRPDIPPWTAPGRIWTLPVLGGAGGQTLAGAVSTGTHGGFVARPPLSDAVCAIALVGSDGVLTILEPRKSNLVGANGVVDETVLATELGQRVVRLRDDGLFDAALVGVGRLGVIWAYVLELHDETNVAVVETRTESTWQQVRQTLAHDLAQAVVDDDYHGVVINPLRDLLSRNHKCWEIRQEAQTGGHPTDPRQDPQAQWVTDARRPSPILQLLSRIDIPPVVAAALGVVGGALTLQVPVVGLPFGITLAAGTARLGQPQSDGETYLVGDLVADLLNSVRLLDRPWVALRMLQGEIMNSTQHPWVVKGTRFEIADVYDYTGTAFLGDSIELFFEVDTAAPEPFAGSIDAVLDVFDQLYELDLPVAAFVSVRFMSQSRATLGLARWPLTCSVEVAMLRGLPGNARALAELTQVARNNGGVVHWGQQHDVEALDVHAAFGSAMASWQSARERLEPGRLFKNAFTHRRGLESTRSGAWAGWTDLGQQGQGAVGLPVGFETNGVMEVFARDAANQLQSLRLDSSGMPDPSGWATVRPEAVRGRPSVFRGIDGRIDVFAIMDGPLGHTFRRQDGSFEAWDFKGSTGFHVDTPEVGVAAHPDGRLEVFGRASASERTRLAHVWENFFRAPVLNWTWVHHEGEEPLWSAPSAVARRLPDGREHLVVGATLGGPDPAVAHESAFRYQLREADDADWSGWTPVSNDPNVIISGPTVMASAPELATYLFAVDGAGTIQMATDSGLDLRPEWSGWTPLPGAKVPQLAIPAVVAHRGRIWVACRTVDDEIACWDFPASAAPAPPGEPRLLGGEGYEHVAIAGHPMANSVQVVARATLGQLFGRKVDPFDAPGGGEP